MRASSIKDGPAQAETGSYLPVNNTETVAFPASIISQQHMDTFCPCPIWPVTSSHSSDVHTGSKSEPVRLHLNDLYLEGVERAVHIICQYLLTQI